MWRRFVLQNGDRSLHVSMSIHRFSLNWFPQPSARARKTVFAATRTDMVGYLLYRRPGSIFTDPKRIRCEPERITCLVLNQARQSRGSRPTFLWLLPIYWSNTNYQILISCHDYSVKAKFFGCSVFSKHFVVRYSYS